MIDLLESYISRVKGRLDAPDTFIEASAYNLVSSLLGRYFRCSFIPGTPNVGFRPNTWFLLSSIPARTRRSTVLNYSNYVYKEALKGHLIQMNVVPKTTEAQERVDDTIIEEGSPEGIMDHIDLTSEYSKSYAIISSEFGSVLSNIQNKDYQKGVSTLLSKLYYGESGTVMLSKRNKEQTDNKKKGRRHIPEGLYVTMFAAMQEPKYYLSPIMVGQGLMRRIILLYIKSSDMSMDTWKEPLQPRFEVYREFSEIIPEIQEMMLTYNEICENRHEQNKMIDTVFRDMTFINSIARKHDEDLLTEESLYNIYMQGYWEHLTKISMLHAIARKGIDERTGYLSVSRDDVQKAHDFLQRATKYSQEAIENLGSMEVTEKDITSVINKVYNRIKNHPDGVQRSVLYRVLGHIPSQDLDGYISQLITQERITVEQRQTAGRPALYYKVIS